MSYVRLRAELLAAREARDALLATLLDEVTTPLVMMSSAIPGPDKAPSGSTALFTWGLRQLQDRLDCRRLLAHGEDALGPYGFIAAAAVPRRVIMVSLLIEAALPPPRLSDLDVFAADGSRIGRAELGEPARRCLLCAEPAVDCIRLNRHPMEHLRNHVGYLLASFTASVIEPLTDTTTGGAAGHRPAAGA